MGRKPNALILEFFERGEKLADQSNRYSHSCKRCGEVFPKGRPDSLTRHLFEKCPNMTDEDRSRALWQPSESSTASDSELPLLSRREPSGLDALAEVSRQLQANGQHEETMVAQLRQHMDQQDNAPLIHTANAASELLQPQPHALVHAQTQTQPVQPHGRKRRAEEPLTPYHSHRPHHPPVDPQLQHPDDYSTFVNHLEEETNSDHRPVQQPAQQPQLQPQSQQLQQQQQQQPVQQSQQLQVQHQQQHQHQHEPQQAQQQTQQLQQHQQQQPQQLQQYEDPLPFVVNHGGFGLLQRANKSRTRGRFTEERRKEVQTVRKKGACIRCRMLKKPCSEGTPCGTCQNIESARLWKNACIRSRVADEFTLYSVSLFYARDHHSLVSALAGLEPMPLTGRIEVTLFPDTQTYATFSALMTPAGCCLLNYRRDPDTLAATLERYLHMAIMHCISREPSSFMRSTLELATELSVDHNDVLLGKLINLWAATNILISNQPIWSVFYEPSHAPVMDAVQDNSTGVDTPESSQPAKPKNNRKPFSADSRDYAVICAQLQHAAERYCQKQAKSVMSELERRLLQRQQSSSFLTFLAAVILLNCVERMTGLYHSFDPSKKDDLHIDLTNDESSEVPVPVPVAVNNQEKPAGWPLEDPPARFWPQGETFSNLVHLLLRMRGLPPPTLIRPNGSLVIMLGSSNKAYVSENQGAADSQLQLAAAWIERTSISAIELLHVKDKPLSELGPDPRDWDLRFIAPLLLPGGGVA